MLTVLLILSVLIWVPILFHNISHRGFLILLIWLCIAPVATNLIAGQGNPFFKSPSSKVSSHTMGHNWYKTGTSNISWGNIIEPTRNLAVAFVLALLLTNLIKRRPLLRLDKTELWMALFSIIAVSSALFRSNRLFFAMHIAIDAFIVPFLGYYIARRLVTDEERFLRLSRVLAYTGFYVIVACLLERLVNDGMLYRLSGPFRNGSMIHIVLVVVFFSIMASSRGIQMKRLVLPVPIQRFVRLLIPVIILLTWSRANWLGLLMALVLFLTLRHHLTSPLTRMRTIGVALALVSAMLVILQIDLPDQIGKRAGNVNTIEWRLQRWDVTIQEAVKHPIFGVGLNNVRDALDAAGLNTLAAHSAYLSFFADLGLVGLLSYLAVILSMTHFGWQLYRKGTDPAAQWRGAAIIAVMVAYQVPAFFSNTIYSYDLGAIYVYVFSGAIAGLYRTQPSLSLSFLARLRTPTTSYRPQLSSSYLVTAL